MAKKVLPLSALAGGSHVVRTGALVVDTRHVKAVVAPAMTKSAAAFAVGTKTLQVQGPGSVHQSLQ